MASSVRLASRIASLQARSRDLAKDEIFDSAVLLSGVTLSLSEQHAKHLPEVGNGSHLESIAVCADILYLKGEYARALAFYERALKYFRTLFARFEKVDDHGMPRKGDGEYQEGDKSLGNRGLNKPKYFANVGRAQVSNNTNESDIKNDVIQVSISTMPVEGLKIDSFIRFGIAKCQVKLKKTEAALKTMEHIKSSARTGNMKLFMAQLYKLLRMDHPATKTYKEAVRVNPYALDAYVSLMRMGVLSDDISSVLVANAALEDREWILNFLEAHGLLALNQHLAALESFEKLKAQYMNTVHVSICIGELQTDLNNLHIASVVFTEARLLDKKNIDGMDAYAKVLYKQRDASGLNSLSRDLMDIDSSRAEPWVAVAYFCELKGDTPTALKFAGKALEMDSTNASAHRLEGNLQLAMGQPELGILSLYQAYLLRRDFSAYRGLVTAYLAIPRLNEALRIAKEALQLMPKDPRAVMLIGNVFARMSGDGCKKASKAYIKALKLDPSHDEAAVAFADLYLQQHKAHPRSFDLQPAINVLLMTLQHQSKDILHVKLGEVYSANGDYGSALEQYHNALSLRSELEVAKVGIEKLEKLMQGIDPDAENAQDINSDKVM